MNIIGASCGRLIALGLLILIENGQAQTQAWRFFDDNVVHEIRLDVDPSDWASLQAHYLDNTYYRAQFTWNGINQTIGIRSRWG